MKLRFSIHVSSAVLAASSSFALAAPSPQVGGQVDHAQGFGSTWAFGIRITDLDQTGNHIGPGLRVKDVGGQGNVLPHLFDFSSLPTNTLVPNFELVEQVVHPNGTPMIIDVDAHSSSNATLPRFHNVGGDDGVPDWGTSRWLGLSMALKQAPTGYTGSLFDQPKAGVVAYYFKDNTGIDPLYSHTSFIEHTRRELGLRGRPFANISSLDYGVGAAVFTHPDMSGVTFNDGAFYYFSVSPEFVTAYGVNDDFAEVEVGAAMTGPRAGDIYIRQWSGSSWSVPKIYRTATELGLDPMVGDVDALEVDHSNRVLVFSVSDTEAFVGTGETSQIMVYQRAKSEITQSSDHAHLAPMRDTDGVKVMTKVNLGDTGGNGTGEIGALCAIDPEVTVPVSPIGLPLGISDVNSRYLGMSVAREAVDAGNPALGSQVVIQVDGWGTFLTPGVGKLILEKRTHGDPAAIWENVETRVRLKRHNRVDFIIPDPDSFVLGNQAIDLRAAYIDDFRHGRTFSPEFSIQFDG